MADGFDALRGFVFDDRPLVVEVDRPLHPANQRLMDSLGVEVRIVTSQAIGARSMGSFIVDGAREPFVENLIDFRHSLVQAAKRADLGDETLEICPHCMCEVDIDPQPHRPGCPGIGKPRATSAPVLAKLAEEDSSSERAVDPEPEGAPQLPAPDAGGLDEQQPPMGARTAAATDAAGEPEPGPAPDRGSNPFGLQKFGRGYVWTRLAALSAVRAFVEEHDRSPQAADAKNALGRMPSLGSAENLFGGWDEMVTAAGFTPAPKRLPREKRPARPQAVAAEPEEATSEERAPCPVAGAVGARSSGADPVVPDAIGELRAAVLTAVNAMFDVLEKAETLAASR